MKPTKQAKDGKIAAKEVNVMPKAFVTMALHSVRHPHQVVHGVLLGNFDKDQCTITVQDAVPVCHGSPTMPIVETALGLIEIILKSQSLVSSRLIIVGWYTAPMLLEDTQPGPPALRMVANLASVEATGTEDDNAMDPTLLVLHNQPILEYMQINSESNTAATKEATFIQCYGRDFGNQWLDPISTKVNNTQTGEKSVASLQKAAGKGFIINDLVDHLDGSPSTTWYPYPDVINFFS